MIKTKPFHNDNITPEELFNEATKGKELSSGDMRLLTSGLRFLREAHAKPLNDVEIKSVWGLLAYAAYTQNVSEEMVTFVLLSHFNVKDVASLPSRHYNDIIEFLVDLEMNKIVN